MVFLCKTTRGTLLYKDQNTHRITLKPEKHSEAEDKTRALGEQNQVGWDFMKVVGLPVSRTTLLKGRGNGTFYDMLICGNSLVVRQSRWPWQQT